MIVPSFRSNESGCSYIRTASSCLAMAVDAHHPRRSGSYDERRRKDFHETVPLDP